MLRVVRNHRRAAYGHSEGYEGLTITPVPLDHAALPRRSAPRGGAPRLGPRHRARREARLPQRPGHRDRADRHDRPGHGLRHHRHRARLRAREVQEARRRRLLQDHQPGRPAGAHHARLHARADRRDRRLLPSATARSGRRPRSTRRRSRPRASTPRPSPRSKAGLPSAFDLTFVFNRWTLGDEFLHRDPQGSGRPPRTTRRSTCSPPSASRRSRSTTPTSTSAAR